MLAFKLDEFQLPTCLIDYYAGVQS